MNQRRSPALARREAFGGHLDDRVEIAPREIAIGPRAAHQREQLVFAVVAARGLGDDLLRQHVERRVVRDDQIELAAPARAQQGEAFDQVVARRRKHAAFRQARYRMSRSADALQQRRDAARRADLADEIDRADVDAELQRRRRDQRLQLTRLQPRLRVETLLFRQTPMMRRHRIVAQPLAEMTREPLRQPPRVHEDQRGLMRFDQLRQPIVVLLPDLVRHHRVERRARHLEAEIHVAAMTFVHHRASGRARFHSRRFRFRRRRSTFAGDVDVGVPTRKRATSSMGFCVAERPRRISGASATCCRRSSDSARCAPRRVPITAWISSTITVRTVRSMLARAFGGQQQIERFRRGDQDVRRRPQHRRAFLLGRVAGAHRGRDARRFQAGLLGQLPDAAARLGEVLVDVGAQRLQRRDVDDAHLVRKRAAQAFREEVVERRQERGERFTGSGRRGDQRVAAFTNRGPALPLRGRRLAERVPEPARHERMKRRQRHNRKEQNARPGRSPIPSIAPMEIPLIECPVCDVHDSIPPRRSAGIRHGAADARGPCRGPRARCGGRAARRRSARSHHARPRSARAVSARARCREDDQEGEPIVVSDRGGAITWDGDYLPGPWLVRRAIDTAQQRIANHGVVTLVIRRSHHIGCLQAYLKPVTDAGLIIILTCSDPANTGVTPFGGTAPRITPNPIAAGFPTGMRRSSDDRRRSGADGHQHVDDHQRDDEAAARGG